jgi:hypothetical protein
MKDINQIRLEIEKLYRSLEIVKFKYSSLNQIDKLSGEGSELLDLKSKIEGQIMALRWIID